MKVKYSFFFLTAVIVILTAGLVGVLVYLKNQPPQERGVAPLVEIEDEEPDSSKWALNFPNQYDTLQTTLTNNTRTKYGGSEKYSKLKNDTRLITLFAGYSFSLEYNEDRGHLNSLPDVREIKRVNEKTAGTCYSCKSAANPRL